MSELLGDQAGARLYCCNLAANRSAANLACLVFPQIRKYRRSLIEVLLASLVLQLLNLAQPLVMQQIFDKVIGQQNLDTLYTLGLILLLVSLFQGLIGAVRTYLLQILLIGSILLVPRSFNIYFAFLSASTDVLSVNFRPAPQNENIRNFLTGTLTLALDAVFSVIYIAVMVVIAC